jgi:hypothetical protein
MTNLRIYFDRDLKASFNTNIRVISLAGTGTKLFIILMVGLITMFALKLTFAEMTMN